MAIYHLNAKVGSRTSGQSAGAKHDYVCREGRYANGEARLAKRNEAELVYRNSGNMPQWAKNEPAMYWKAADLYERANGRLFQSVEIALPMELGKNEQIALAEKFASEIAKTKDGVFTKISPERGSASFPLMSRAMSSRILMSGRRPAAPSAPTSKLSTWTSPMASWTLLSRPTFKAPRSTA